MSQIFKQQKQFVKAPGRNNFDLSFDNNFSTKIGQLTPVFIKEVMPGDKFRIDSSIGLRAMPLAFPVQSPLQAHLSFFYIPIRILWENWKDFVSDTQTHEHPYLSIPFTRASEIGTGTLADYLGVPTTYASETETDWMFTPLFGAQSRNIYSDGNIYATESVLGLETHLADDPDNPYQVGEITGALTQTQSFQPIWLNNYANIQVGTSVSSYFGGPTDSPWLRTDKITTSIPYIIKCNPISYTNTAFSVRALVCVGNTFENSQIALELNYDYSYDSNLNEATLTLTTDVSNWSYPGSYYLLFDGFTTIGGLAEILLSPDLTTSAYGNSMRLRVKFANTSDVQSTSNPFVIQSGDSTPDIKLNVLPFRAYEAIYNSYYRNHNDVDPFMLGGQKQYNRFCTNLSDGADSTTPLYLRNVNYELDYLTSCLLSPQFGDAPLVGVSAVGEFTFEDENGQTFKVMPKIGDDGDTLTGIDAYTDGTPVGTLQRLNNAIKYGISISDFRNVNSLQRFLENHLRRGLKYEQVTKAHYGTNMRYTSVDEPLYIGGMTRTISVTQINATAQSDGIKLGDYVGQAGLFGKQKHAVNHYVDECGFIIGLLHITPIPTYSQLLPKLYLKDNLLSYPFPLEFRHIGLQPIDYREVTPIQAKMYNVPYTNTFGYQRPYYDFISSVDENHGEFRTTMQGYVFTRNFGEPPQLGHKFITVDPADMTNPFIDVSSEADTFIGQIHFDVKAKRPIARIHTPALE